MQSNERRQAHLPWLLKKLQVPGTVCRVSRTEPREQVRPSKQWPWCLTSLAKNSPVGFPGGLEPWLRVACLYRPFSFGRCWHDAVRCNGGAAEMVLNASLRSRGVRPSTTRQNVAAKGTPAESGVARFAVGLAARLDTYIS
jgi:hypothetical protein